MHTACVPHGSQRGYQPVDRARYTLPSPILNAYLSRLHLQRTALGEPGLATLTILQEAHVAHIAYENVGLHSGPGGTPARCPELDPHRSAERVSVGRRGGYCFIIVEAYAALLSTLGFTVTLHVGGVGEQPLPAEKWGPLPLTLNLSANAFSSSVANTTAAVVRFTTIAVAFVTLP